VEANNGNVERAAIQLGISEPTVYREIKKWKAEKQNQ